MLRMDSRNVNFNAVSLIDDEQVAAMGANISGSNIYFNITIDNVTKYLDNEEAVDADVEAFKSVVIDAI